MTRRSRRRLLSSTLLALAVATALTATFAVEDLAIAQTAITDLFFRTRPSRPARATVIVGIDQRSYQALLADHGPMSAWPRSLYGRALDALAAAGPRVVAFAIFFDSPRPGDADLAAAMRRAGTVLTPVEAQGPKAFDPRPGVAQQFEAFVRPTRTVREAAAGEGLTNVTTDRDSVVRSLPLALSAGGEQLPSLALTIVARFTRRPAVFDAPPAGSVVYAAGRAIPVTARDTLAINYLGPPSRPGGPGPFPILSFVDVLAGRFDPEVIRDRIVLFGPTVRGVDEHATPTSGDVRMWGVEVLANAVETVLAQRYLVRVSPGVTVGSIFVLALLGGAVVVALRPVRAVLAALGLLVLYIIVGVVLFDSGLLLDLVYPPAALVLTCVAALVHRIRFGEAEQRAIGDAMARYLSPAVSRWVLEDPDRLRLGGELREMTVLFSDLRNFTTLAQTLPPETLVALLNLYRTEMTDLVLRHDGVLAQYAGDAIEAFWNAPMAQPDHARRACEAALDMLARVADLRPEFARQGWANLDLGIGINTGRMVVGNMGSRNHLAYTAAGDAVNVAARIEGLCKTYGARVVIGEATRAAAGPALVYRELDLVVVKGRDEPLTVYEVLGHTGALAPGLVSRLARYHEAITCYRARRWTQAVALLDALAAEAPDDGPIALYRRRCAALLAEPPPPDWNGVYVARTK